MEDTLHDTASPLLWASKSLEDLRTILHDPKQEQLACMTRVNLFFSDCSKDFFYQRILLPYARAHLVGGVLYEDCRKVSKDVLYSFVMYILHVTKKWSASDPWITSSSSLQMTQYIRDCMQELAEGWRTKSKQKLRSLAEEDTLYLEIFQAEAHIGLEPENFLTNFGGFSYLDFVVENCSELLASMLEFFPENKGYFLSLEDLEGPQYILEEAFLRPFYDDILEVFISKVGEVF